MKYYGKPTNEPSVYVECAKKMVVKILRNGEETPVDTLYEIFGVNTDEKILLAHLKAITNIMNKAIEEIEKSEVNE